MEPEQKDTAAPAGATHPSPAAAGGVSGAAVGGADAVAGGAEDGTKKSGPDRVAAAASADTADVELKDAAVAPVAVAPVAVAPVAVAPAVPDVPPQTVEPNPSQQQKQPRPDPNIELEEAFEGFSPSSVGKRRKKKKSKTKQKTKGGSGAINTGVKIQLKNFTPQPSKKAKVGSSYGVGLAKMPVRPFGTLGGVDSTDALFGEPDLSDDEEGGAEDYYTNTTSSYAQEFEDSLNFYAETHEEQDPVYAEFAATKAKERREEALARLDTEDAEERTKLDGLIALKMQDQDRKFGQQIEAMRRQTAIKQAKQKEELLVRYQDHVQKDKNKILEGQNWLTLEHRKSVEKANEIMQQRMQEKRMTQEQANAEWQVMQQQVQARHQKQLMQIKEKGEELRRKTGEMYTYQGAQMTEHHKKRQREMEATIEKLTIRYRQNQEQMRHRYLRRYEERAKRKREAVLKRFALIEPKARVKPTVATTTPERTKETTTDDRLTPTGTGSSTPLKKNSPGEKKSEGTPHHHHHSHHHHGRSSSNEKFHYFHDLGSDAIQRQKRRKAILNSSSVALQVEVHNEGVVFMPRTLDTSHRHKQNNDDATKEDAKKYHAFVPWGVRARTLLYSIICGEVPQGFGWDEIPYAGSLQAGQVKCMVTDMRTSEATAAAQRAMAMKEQGIARTKSHLTGLKQKAQEAAKAATDAEEQSQIASQEEKNLIEKLQLAEKEQGKARQVLSSFKQKASAFFNTDGTLAPITTEANQQKLLAALEKYRSRVEQADKIVGDIKAKLKEAKVVDDTLKKAAAHAVKSAHIAENAVTKAVKKAQIEHNKDSKGRSGRSSPKSKAAKLTTEGDEDKIAECRVEHILDAIWSTAERRRSQLDMKRRGNWGSDWNEGAPHWPDSVKQALWGKMQRRRLQMVLRPTRSSVLADVKTSLKEITDRDPSRMVAAKSQAETSLEQQVRAEQLLLLSLHPVAGSPRPSSAPSSSSSGVWAEPGWHVVLDVPKGKARTSLLPPTGSADTLLSTFRSDCESVPGRQVAAAISQTHLRMLCNPLSTISQASAPAEAHPSGAPKLSKSTLELDPLRTTDEEMQAGYNFVIKPSKKSSSSRKRSSSTKSSSKEEKSTANSPKKRQRTTKAPPANSSSKNVASASGVSASPTSRKKTPTAKDQSRRDARTKQVLEVQEPKKTTSPSQPSTPPTEQAPQPMQQQQQQQQQEQQQQQINPPLEPVRTFTPQSPPPVPTYSPRSPALNSNTSPSHQRVLYQAGAVQNSRDAEVAIPQPPPPPQVQPIPYQQQQQQQQQADPNMQRAYYQQQVSQQQQEAMRRFYAAQQQQGMRSPMQMGQMQVFPPQPIPPGTLQRSQSAQAYSGQSAPLPMQGRGRAVSQGHQPQMIAPGQMAAAGQQQMQGIPMPGNVQQRSATVPAPRGSGTPNINDPLLQLYANKNQQQKR